MVEEFVVGYYDANPEKPYRETGNAAGDFMQQAFNLIQMNRTNLFLTQRIPHRGMLRMNQRLCNAAQAMASAYAAHVPTPATAEQGAITQHYYSGSMVTRFDSFGHATDNIVEIVDRWTADPDVRAKIMDGYNEIGLGICGAAWREGNERYRRIYLVCYLGYRQNEAVPEMATLEPVCVAYRDGIS